MTAERQTTNYSPSTMPTPRPGAAPTPSGLSPVSSTWSNAAIALPDVLQSYAQNRRSGTLVVYRAQQPHFLGLQQGNIVYLTGTAPGSLLRALVWTGHLDPDQVPELQERLPADDAAAAREMLDEELVPVPAVIDALSCLIEETFHEAFLEKAPEWDLAHEDPPDDWARVQQNIGVSIGISGLLMELMRRRDETQALADHLADDWDLPLVERDLPEEGPQIDPEMRAIFSYVDGTSPVCRVLEQSWLIPSFGRMALAGLLQGGWLRLADRDDLVVLADTCRRGGRDADAEGLYRRALDRGLQLPRVRFALAELLAARGANRDAAAAFLESGTELEQISPENAAKALRNAQRLGADPKVCLRRLAMIENQLGNRAAALEALWKLVDHLEEDGDLDAAAQALQEVADLGADRRRLLLRQGDLAQRTGDYAQAMEVWEELESLIDREAEPDAIAELHAHILALDPGRCHTALFHAKHLQEHGDQQAAAGVLRAALTAAGPRLDQDLAISCHELLAEVDPQDATNRQWLARSYRRREDRNGALAQLQSLAQTHEASGNRSGLTEALAEIIEIDPLQVGSVRRLTGLYEEDGRNEAALLAWRRTVEAALEKGEAATAVDLGEEAAHSHPLSVHIRLLLVKGANRLGRREVAVRHCLAAARLARISGDMVLAKQCLLQLVPVLRDDLALHAEVVDLLQESDDDDLVTHLGPAVAVAMRTANYGLAVRWGEARVELEGDTAWDARTDLVRAYHRAGEHLQAQAAGEHLADDLISHGRQTDALNLLEMLTGHYPRSTNLVLMQTRLYRDLGRKRDASEGFQRMIQLLQQEQRIKEAQALVRELVPLIPDRELLARVEQQLEAGTPISWT